MRSPILYRTLVADPAWMFGDKLPGQTRGAEQNYRCMRLEDVKRYPLPTLHEDALLFLWRVGAMQEEALSVMRAWGFVPKSEIVWIKTAAPRPSGDLRLAFGMGRYVRNCHEVCLIGRRGRGQVLNHSTRSVFFAPPRAHSEKPDEFFAIVEKLAAGPRAELFGRKVRPGWDVWGDELGAPNPNISAGERT